MKYCDVIGMLSIDDVTIMTLHALSATRKCNGGNDMTSVEKSLVENVEYEGYDGGEEEEEEEEKCDPIDDIRDSRTAWIICFCAVIDQLFITGLINVFGVFFVEFVKEFGASRGKAAWLGSLSYGLMKLFAPAISVFVRRYTNRVSMVIGSALCAVSVFTTSFAPNIDIMFFTFPFLYGIGTSFVINPVMVIASGYFKKHLGIATGLVCAGSSLGSVTLAPLCQMLVDRIGWRLTFRCLTGVYIFLCFLNLLVKPLPKHVGQGPIDTISQPLVRGLVEDLKLWKNRVFVLWATATAFVMFGYYVPSVHLMSYANDCGIPSDTAAYLIMAQGGATTIGRLLSGRIVQHGFMNRLHLHQLTMILTGTGFMILPCITSFPGLLAYVIVVGVIDGCYIVLLPILTCVLIGADKAVVAWCFMSGFSSLTFTLGPPISGFICDITGSYNVAFHTAGIPIILGAVILFFVPWAERTSTTTNIMRVLSTNVDDEPRSTCRSLGTGSSDETIHLSVPESGFFHYNNSQPCFIDPQYGGSRLQFYSLEDPPCEDENDPHRQQATTGGGGGGSAPDICGGQQCEEDKMCGQAAPVLPPNSAPVFDVWRDLPADQFIAIPGREVMAIEGYLEELKRVLGPGRTTTGLLQPQAQPQEATSSLVPPAVPPQTQSQAQQQTQSQIQSQAQSQAQPQQTASVPATSVASSMDQLIKEHIEKFLAELAARNMSGISASSMISGSVSRTQRAVHEDGRSVSNTSGQMTNVSSNEQAVDSRSRTSNPFRPAGGGSSTSGGQHRAAQSVSRTSDTSNTSARSAHVMSAQRTSSTSTGEPRELDVFCHLFKDEET